MFSCGEHVFRDSLPLKRRDGCDFLRGNWNFVECSDLYEREGGGFVNDLELILTSYGTRFSEDFVNLAIRLN